MKMYCRQFVICIRKTKLCLSFVFSVPHVIQEKVLRYMCEHGRRVPEALIFIC